jgi:hypothetical protein
MRAPAQPDVVDMLEELKKCQRPGNARAQLLSNGGQHMKALALPVAGSYCDIGYHSKARALSAQIEHVLNLLNWTREHELDASVPAVSHIAFEAKHACAALCPVAVTYTLNATLNHCPDRSIQLDFLKNSHERKVTNALRRGSAKPFYKSCHGW